MISAYVDREQKEWDQHLHLLTAAYRCCRHESTGFSPNMLMFGREVFLPVEIELGCPQPGHHTQDYGDYVHELRQKLNMVHELARENTQAATERQKRDCDTGVSMKRYKVGDLVDYANRNKEVGKSPKLEANKWIGPCVVLAVYSDLDSAVTHGPRSKVRILHHDNLKPHLGTTIPEWAETQQGRLQSAEQPKQTSPLCTKAKDMERPVEPVAMDTIQDNLSRSMDITSDPVQAPGKLAPQHNRLRQSLRICRPPDRFGQRA